MSWKIQYVGSCKQAFAVHLQQFRIEGLVKRQSPSVQGIGSVLDLPMIVFGTRTSGVVRLKFIQGRLDLRRLGPLLVNNLP